MNTFYNVQSIELNQEWMTRILDIATYQIPIKVIYWTMATHYLQTEQN